MSSLSWQCADADFFDVCAIQPPALCFVSTTHLLRRNYITTCGDRCLAGLRADLTADLRANFRTNLSWRARSAR